MDPVPDPLLIRKSGSAGNRTRDLCIYSQKLWPLDHRGGLTNTTTETIFTQMLHELLTDRAWCWWFCCWVLQRELLYLLECKMRFYLEIWYLNMWDCLKFAYEAPNWITLDMTLWNQTKACIAKSSCVDKREKRAWLQLSDEPCLRQIFKRKTPFRKTALFLSSGKEAPNLVDPLDWAT